MRLSSTAMVPFVKLGSPGQVTSRCEIDVQAFERHFEAVLETFLLLPNFALALTQFFIQQRLQQSTGWHSNDTARPSGLGFPKEAVDAEDAGPLQDLHVWDSVPPPDVYKSVKTAHVKMVELFGVSAVDSPGFTDIEEGGKYHCTVDLQLGGKA